MTACFLDRLCVMYTQYAPLSYTFLVPPSATQSNTEHNSSPFFYAIAPWRLLFALV
jgi:hypothetical protein